MCFLDIFRPALIVFELLALSGYEKGPEAGISGRWRHPATVTWPFERPTSVRYLCFVNNHRPARTIQSH
jgi:hypothetical protein